MHRQERVEAVLAELRLGEVADDRVGDRTKGSGISGGQRRRLSFAKELLGTPRVLVADEPTTGLDSHQVTCA